MRTLKTVIAIAGMLALILATQAPASAHADGVRHGLDDARVSADHMRGRVCDWEPDGHWVKGEFWLEDGSKVVEYDGGDATCDDVTFSSPATYFAVCEENEGCNSENT